MKKSIFLLLAFSSIGLHAQTSISVGVKAGLNIPKITAAGNNPMSKGYSSRLAGNAGIFGEFRFSELFAIEANVMYTQQGGKRDGMQAIPTAILEKFPQFAQIQPALTTNGVDYLYADFKSVTKFNYIMVPVHAKFGWRLGAASPFRVDVGAGPFVSFLMSAKQVTKGSSHMYVDSKGTTTLDAMLGLLMGSVAPVIGEQPMKVNRDITDDLRKVNFGVSAAASLSYDLDAAAKHRIFLEAGGNYGFVKLQRDATNGQNRIGAGTVALGYSMRIN